MSTSFSVPVRGLDAATFTGAQRLRVVSMVASGYDAVDLEAATRHGVVVTNAPAPMSEGVADLTFGLVLAVARSIPQRYHRLVALGQEDRSMGTLVYGKTLGIVGLGHIGKAVARRARGFDMRLLAADLDGFWDADFAARYEVERHHLDDLLRESDFISVHLRLTPSTLGIIGEREFALMKSSAFLINTARAALVDNAALYRALVDKRIAGAALDTIIDDGFDTPLLGLPNVVGTPHIGGRCFETALELVNAAIENALMVLQGGRPATVVNPAVYETR